LREESTQRSAQEETREMREEREERGLGVAAGAVRLDTVIWLLMERDGNSPVGQKFGIFDPNFLCSWASEIHVIFM
jgi:hypothetical protein